MEAQQLQQLDLFDQAVLRPAVSRIALDGTYTERAVAAANLYEAFLWLHIGVKNRVYRADHASRLIEPIFTLLYRDFDSFSWWHLLPRAREVLRHARQTGRFFGAGASAEEEPGQLLANRFSLSVLALSQFMSDLAAQTLISTLVFADERRWHSLMARPPSSEMIVQSLGAEYDPWEEGYQRLAYGGCLQVVKHIELLLELFGDVVHGGTHDLDLLQLRLDIAEAHEWRFFFRDERFKSRFESIMHATGRALTDELVRSEIAINPGGFDEYIADLIQRWMAFTTPRALRTQA
jgi:hypothetical protein